MRLVPLLAVLCLFAPVSPAQRKVDARNLHERILLILPMMPAGTGGFDNPRRPLLTPAAATAARSGILSWSYELSDDGQFALVEFVAREKAPLAALLADARVLKSFEKGKHSRQEIETEFKKFKKDFDLEKFAGRLR